VIKSRRVRYARHVGCRKQDLVGNPREAEDPEIDGRLI
jgi:hypothetical protein